MANSGGRDRISSNGGECFGCFSCRTKAVQGLTGTRSESPSSDDAWERRVWELAGCSSCQDRCGKGGKDCCLYGKCCFFDCLRQVRKQLGGLCSPSFSYFLDLVLKLKDAQVAAALTRKGARRGSYTALSHSYTKCLDVADISRTSYLQARSEWSDIGRESDSGTTYIIFDSVFDFHNMKMVQSSQPVIKAHFLEVLSEQKGGTICFHVLGREVVRLHLLHVSSSSLSNRHLLQGCCLQLPNYGDEVILNSAFLDIKCDNFDHYPKGNQFYQSEGILKDDGDCSYQHIRVSKRSNDGYDGYTAEFCRPKKKICFSPGNVAFKVNSAIDALLIDDEEQEGFLQHSQSNMQLRWSKGKNNYEHLKQKVDPFMVEKNSGPSTVNVTHHEGLESYGKSNKKLQHELVAQKYQSKSNYLFNVVENIHQTYDSDGTSQQNSKLSESTAKKQPKPWHGAILDKRESPILHMDSATFQNCIPESCSVADNFLGQLKKVTSVEYGQKIHTLGLTCEDSLKLNEVSPKNHVPFYHGSGQNIFGPLPVDEDYESFLNIIKQNGPSDPVKKGHSMFSAETTEREKPILDAVTVKIPPGSTDVNLMDDHYASFLDHIRDNKSSHMLRHRNVKNRKPCAWNGEKVNLMPSACMWKKGPILPDNKQQLDMSQCAAPQNGVECSLVDSDYENFLECLHVHRSSRTCTFENQLDGDLAGFMYDEYNIFLPARWHHNKKMKREDGCHLSKKQQVVADGTKREKNIMEDQDYEQFLRNFRIHGKSYVLEVTDTETGNLIIYKYEKSEDECIFPQNTGSRKHTVMLRDVKRVGSDPLDDISNDRKHLDYPLKIRRSPRFTQLTERKIYSSRISDSILPANTPEDMASDLGPSEDEAPGNFNYSFDCGRLESFSDSLHALLRKPYDGKEHKELIEEANRHKPITRERNLRGHSKTYSTQQPGLSYMDHYPDLHERIRVADDGQQLKLLRGFFFWLQNSCREDSFMPWLFSTSKGDVVHIVDD
ncbi:unnamed protein product [Victoria cruziana]